MSPWLCCCSESRMQWWKESECSVLFLNWNSNKQLLLVVRSLGDEQDCSRKMLRLYGRRICLESQSKR